MVGRNRVPVVHVKVSLENLLAATSPDYLANIQEAREDYRHGRTVPL